MPKLLNRDKHTLKWELGGGGGGGTCYVGIYGDVPFSWVYLLPEKSRAEYSRVSHTRNRFIRTETLLFATKSCPIRKLFRAQILTVSYLLKNFQRSSVIFLKEQHFMDNYQNKS